MISTFTLERRALSDWSDHELFIIQQGFKMALSSYYTELGISMAEIQAKDILVTDFDAIGMSWYQINMSA